MNKIYKRKTRKYKRKLKTNTINNKRKLKTNTINNKSKNKRKSKINTNTLKFKKTLGGDDDDSLNLTGNNILSFMKNNNTLQIDKQKIIKFINNECLGIDIGNIDIATIYEINKNTIGMDNLDDFKTKFSEYEKYSKILNEYLIQDIDFFIEHRNDKIELYNFYKNIMISNTEDLIKGIKQNNDNTNSNYINNFINLIYILNYEKVLMDSEMFEFIPNILSKSSMFFRNPNKNMEPTNKMVGGINYNNIEYEFLELIFILQLFMYKKQNLTRYITDKIQYSYLDIFLKLLLIKIYYNINNIENLQKLKQTDVFSCIRFRFKQFSGTCWFSSFLNCLILSPNIKKIILDVLNKDKKYLKLNYQENNVDTFIELFIKFNNKVQNENSKTNLIKIKQIIEKYNYIENIQKIKEDDFTFLIKGIFYLLLNQQKLKNEDDDITRIMANYIKYNYHKIDNTKEIITDGSNSEFAFNILKNLNIPYTNIELCKYKKKDFDLNNINNILHSANNIIIISLFNLNDLIKNNDLLPNNYMDLIKDYHKTIKNQLKLNFDNIMDIIILIETFLNQNNIYLDSACLQDKHGIHTYCGFKCNGEFYEYDANNFLRKNNWFSIDYLNYDEGLDFFGNPNAGGFINNFHLVFSRKQ